MDDVLGGRYVPYYGVLLPELNLEVLGFFASNTIYSHLIETMLKKIIRTKVLPENQEAVRNYLDSEHLYLLRYVVQDNNPVHLQGTDMIDLVSSRMKFDEGRIAPILERIHYHIDTVQDYMGKTHIETVGSYFDYVALASLTFN